MEIFYIMLLLNNFIKNVGNLNMNFNIEVIKIVIVV